MFKNERKNINLKKVYRQNPRGAVDDTQAGVGNAGTDDAASGRQPALERRLRQRCTGVRLDVLDVTEHCIRKYQASIVGTSISGKRSCVN